MGLRRKSRELALQFLFGHDFQQRSNESSAVKAELEMFCQNFDVGEQSLPYAKQLLSGILDKLDEIDSQLARHSHNWRLKRMSLVDLNILRIAVYEMRYIKDVPDRVAINEALEIAKRYSILDSVAFINGILDALRKGIDDNSE